MFKYFVLSDLGGTQSLGMTGFSRPKDNSFGLKGNSFGLKGNNIFIVVIHIVDNAM